MKKVFLLRHADAENGDARHADCDRPLTPRGRQSADRIGNHLASRIQAPPLILCSSAQRTVETLELVGACLSGEPRESIQPELYLASRDALLECLQEVDDAEASVLLIGHNPGIASLAASLLAASSPEAQRINQSFPSAALAEIEFEAECWSQICFGCGALLQFTMPQDLD